jgi:C4-dicarboxylate transporter DctQ subunit
MVKDMFRLVNKLEERLLEPIALILFSISGIIMFMESLLRTIFSYSFDWASEISIYCMVWSVFIILARAGKKGNHIRVEILISTLSPKVKQKILIGVHFLSFIFTIMLIYSSYKMVTHAYKTKQLSLSTLQLPVWLLSTVMIVSGILLALYYLESFINEWNKKRQKGSIEPLIIDEQKEG